MWPSVQVTLSDLVLPGREAQFSAVLALAGGPLGWHGVKAAGGLTHTARPPHLKLKRVPTLNSGLSVLF